MFWTKATYGYWVIPENLHTFPAWRNWRLPTWPLPTLFGCVGPPPNVLMKMLKYFFEVVQTQTTAAYFSLLFI
jgi:hypothetical protein